MKFNFSMWVSCWALIGLTVASSESEAPAWSAKPDREITISMVPAKMAYDTTLLRVRPGEKVKLNLRIQMILNTISFLFRTIPRIRRVNDLPRNASNSVRRAPS